MSSQTIVFGIDGVSHDFVAQLAAQGTMPFLHSLTQEGVFVPMHSSIPAVSSVSWSSIITGANPGQHGIYGFSELIPGTYTVSYPNFRNLQRPAFWQGDPRTSVIVNVPGTYPAQPMNGCLISGFVSPRIEKAVYPREELETIEQMGYEVDLDSTKAGISDRVLYSQLNETHRKREELADHLLEKYDPELFMLVVTGSDRLGHFGWEHWADAEHEHHQKFLDYFSLVDETLRHFAESLGPDDTLIVLSDHGMEAARWEVNLNAYLAEADFLVLDPDDSKKYDRIRPESTAFAMEDGRVYLHEEGRFPDGSVRPGESNGLVEDLNAFLSDLQVEGEPLARAIYRREEIYQGENATDAPHLVVVPNPSLKPVGRLTDELYQPARLPGMHNSEAFLLVRGPNAERIGSGTPGVEDVAALTDT